MNKYSLDMFSLIQIYGQCLYFFFFLYVTRIRVPPVHKVLSSNLAQLGSKNVIGTRNVNQVTKFSKSLQYFFVLKRKDGAVAFQSGGRT